MNDFERIFNDLKIIDKKAINAYRSGREFKSLSAYSIVNIDNRLYPTIIASLCNKIFACELFLKSIIMINKKQLQRGHKISDLIQKSGVSKILEKSFIKYNLENEISQIDNAFQVWRYSYEYDQLTINNGFLNDLCQLLEQICRQKIQEVYNLNMLESFI